MAGATLIVLAGSQAIGSVIAVGASQSIKKCIQHYARTRKEPNSFEATYEGIAPDATAVSWQGPVWPPLPRSELTSTGSGVASYRYRYHVSDAAWSVWKRTKAERPFFDLPGVTLGTHIDVEVIAIDDGGRAHRPVRASLTSLEPIKVDELPGGEAEECSEQPISDS